METLAFLYGDIQDLRHLKNRKQWEPDVGLRMKANHSLLHLRQHCISLISGQNHFIKSYMQPELFKAKQQEETMVLLLTEVTGSLFLGTVLCTLWS